MRVWCSSPAGSKVLSCLLDDRKFHLRLLMFLPFGEAAVVFVEVPFRVAVFLFTGCPSGLSRRLGSGSRPLR